MTEPFLKWAGGKRWLTQAHLPLPSTFGRYIEPFLGGGAVFFWLAPAEAILSDVNADLIELYSQLRDNPTGILDALKVHQERHCKEYYYAVRASQYNCPTLRAARMLYLNRTCWNGLYRVNKQGKFNVPIGTKSNVVLPNDDFLTVSKMLSGVTLTCCDFESSVDMAKHGDFLFIDPPYTVKHNMNGFIKYNETIFSWSDQVRLRDSVQRAISRGAAVVVTNADHESILELYDGIADYRQASRASVLAGRSTARGPTTEALFTANIG